MTDSQAAAIVAALQDIAKNIAILGNDRAQVEKLTQALRHIYGAASEGIPKFARSAADADAAALHYIAMHIEGVLPNVR